MSKALRVKTIEVEVLAGASIDDVATEACALARANNTMILFNFNSIWLYATGETHPHTVKIAYFQILNKRRLEKIDE